MSIPDRFLAVTLRRLPCQSGNETDGHHHRIDIIVMTALQRDLMGVALAAVMGAGIFEAIHASRLDREHRRLLAEQEQLTCERDEALNRLHRITNATPPQPATEAQASFPSTAVADSFTNSLRRLLEGDMPKLTAEQVESFLKANHRNADSLLAMARIAGDKSFLKEAMEKFPDDPRVAFEAVFLNGDATPEERRKWIEKFKQNAPDNALAGYISALEHFKSGQSDQAVLELVTASGKSQFQDYSLDHIQSAEEAYRAAGYPELDTRVAAMSQVLLPHLAQMKQLTQNVVDLALVYRKDGDEASAQELLQYNIQLGNRMTQSPNNPLLITELVGMAIERMTLNALDPQSPFDSTGLTVASRIEQIQQQKKRIKDLNQQAAALLPTLSESDFMNWADRRRTYGEVNTMQWVVNKFGPDSTGSQ